MTDPTNDNDIDALLVLMHDGGWKGFHRALTALVAERNALQEENIALRSRQKSHQDEVLDRVFETDALRKRIAELEAHPPANRDLHERLVCAALTGVCADPNMNDPDIARFAGDIADAAVAIANATLAAMRKGDKNA